MRDRASRTPGSRPAVLLAVLAVGSFFLLPEYLVYAASMSLVAGFVGLGLVIPFAGLREIQPSRTQRIPRPRDSSV